MVWSRPSSFSDTFEIIVSMPTEAQADADRLAFRDWCRRLARGLSARWSDTEKLWKLWEPVIDRFKEFRWALDRNNIFLLYGLEFVRDGGCVVW